MKTTLNTILVILASALFLVASTAMAKGKGTSNLQRCRQGCNMAKQSLIKACNKQTDPKVKSKCKTLGTKKLQEECFARCKTRKKKK